jgi:hypothetical protein
LKDLNVFVLTRMLQITRRWELTGDIDFGKALEATEQILLRRNRHLANNGDQSRPTMETRQRRD